MKRYLIWLNAKVVRDYKSLKLAQKKFEEMIRKISPLDDCISLVDQDRRDPDE